MTKAEAEKLKVSDAVLEFYVNETENGTIQEIAKELQTLRAVLPKVREALECSESRNVRGTGRFGEDVDIDIPCGECRPCKALSLLDSALEGK